jgi:hypothetical protein
MKKTGCRSGFAVPHIADIEWLRQHAALGAATYRSTLA